MSDWEDKLERLRKRAPAEGFVTFPDEEAAQALSVANDNLYLARLRVAETHPEEDVDGHADVTAARGAVARAEKQVDDTDVVFHFRALPPEVYDQMQFQHPPTESQQKLGMAYNPDTYVPAVIAACSVDGITPEQVRDLITPDVDGNTALNQGDLSVMFAKCRQINEVPRANLGKGSRPTEH